MASLFYFKGPNSKYLRLRGSRAKLKILFSYLYDKRENSYPTAVQLNAFGSSWVMGVQLTTVANWRRSLVPGNGSYWAGRSVWGSRGGDGKGWVATSQRVGIVSKRGNWGRRGHPSVASVAPSVRAQGPHKYKFWSGFGSLLVVCQLLVRQIPRSQ